MRNLYGPIIMASLGLFGAIGWLSVPVAKMLSGPIKDGEIQAALEDSFEAQLPVRQFSIDLWGAALASLGEASKGALIGKDGWLFTDEEFQSPPDTNARIDASIAHIVAMVDAAEGATVIVALVPDKARIMSAYSPVQRSDDVENRYTRILSALHSEGIIAPDLRPVMQASDAPFLKTDTHWSPSGSNAVAQAIAAVFPPNFGNSEFDLVTENATLREGDLEQFVPTGMLRPILGPAQQEVPTVTALAIGGDLFADPAPATIALVGTSYSAKEDLGFLPALKAFGHADIINFAQEGRGPFPPMEQFLSSDDHSAYSLIIWEIPERYATVEP